MAKIKRLKRKRRGNRLSRSLWGALGLSVICLFGCACLLTLTASPRQPEPVAQVTPTQTVVVTPSPSPTPSPTAEPTFTSSPTPVPPPTETVTPSPTRFPSGGLGLTRAEWEADHTETELDLMQLLNEQEYDDRLTVYWLEEKIYQIENQDEYPSFEAMRQEAAGLIPHDAAFIETYSPAGIEETTIDLYHSEALASRFPADWFFDGQPGEFSVIMHYANGQYYWLNIGLGRQ